MDYDEHGWARGAVESLPIEGAYSLFARERDSRIDAAAWAAHGRRFFNLEVKLAREKHYQAGTVPLADVAELDVARVGDATSRARVTVVTIPLSRAEHVRAAGMLAAAAIGGAGMDSLIARASRLWQAGAEVAPGEDPRAPLAVAALLAAMLLGPVLPPDRSVVFGVKGARERLARLGWPT